MRQLESIAAARQIHFSASDRHRQRTIDLSLGLGLPVLIMILHTVVQGHRYDILQRVGCIAAVYWSYPAVFLVTIWPPFLLTLAAVYGGECCSQGWYQALTLSPLSSCASPLSGSPLSVRQAPRILQERHHSQSLHSPYRPGEPPNRLQSPHPPHHHGPQHREQSPAPLRQLGIRARGIQLRRISNTRAVDFGKARRRADHRTRVLASRSDCILLLPILWARRGIISGVSCLVVDGAGRSSTAAFSTPLTVSSDRKATSTQSDSLSLSSKISYTHRYANPHLPTAVSNIFIFA